MQIRVEYAAQLKRAAGMARETVDVPESARLDDLVQRITEQHDAALRNILLDDQGRVHPSILVFIGERQIRRDENCELNDGDVVSFLSPISGG